jgi:hypothetical protein
MNKEKRLELYANSSKLMNIQISYGDEDFHFNLADELVINENKINHEAQVQPSSYAFLNMLYKKLIRGMKEVEKKMEKKEAELFIKYKGQIDETTGKKNANETARARVLVNPVYISLQEDFIEAEHQAMIIEVCVKSFEQRVNLIQTLSANLRKEK